MLKKDARALAKEIGLPVHDKKDSTGICFIGERPFRQFLSRYMPTQPGEMVDERGQVVGRHMGLMFYTIGQRRGLGIGGSQDGNGQPWFVTAKDMDTNRLMVVQGHDHPDLLARGLSAEDLTWTDDQPPSADCQYAAKTRYRQQDAPCSVTGISMKQCKVLFAEPQWAVTPGQSLVMYRGDVCLGGGIITTTS
jgi:tRNA-specific 2-thiouridylase